MSVDFCLILLGVFIVMVEDVLDYVTPRCYVVIFERVYLCQSALTIRLSLIFKADSEPVF